MILPAEFQPHPALKPYVKCHWTITGGMDASGLESQSNRFKQFLPDGGLKISFNLEAPVEFILHDGRRISVSTGCMCGALTKNYWVNLTGPIHRIGVQFHPGGVYPFVPFSLETLTDTICDLDQIWGNAGRKLTEDVQHPELTTLQRIARLEKFLLKRLEHFTKHDAVYEYAAHAIKAHQGHVSLRRLSRQVGSSPKQLVRKFRPKSGLAPKHLCRILRFRHLFQHISAHPADNWVNTALACGYYDQAHMIHDFQHFAGISPSNFIKEIVQRNLFINWGYDMDALARFGLGIPA